MKRRIAWLINLIMGACIAGLVGAFVGLLVWFIYDKVRDAVAGDYGMRTLWAWALILVGWLVTAIVIFSVFAGIDTLRVWIRKRQYRLPEGVTMEMVLRESPYELMRGGWGEPKYYIVDKQTGEFVDWEDPEGAEGWIIRQYLQQRRNERQKMRNAASSRNQKGDLS